MAEPGYNAKTDPALADDLIVGTDKYPIGRVGENRWRTGAVGDLAAVASRTDARRVRQFDIRDLGAVADGSGDCSAPIEGVLAEIDEDAGETFILDVSEGAGVYSCPTPLVLPMRTWVKGPGGAMATGHPATLSGGNGAVLAFGIPRNTTTSDNFVNLAAINGEVSRYGLRTRSGSVLTSARLRGSPFDCGLPVGAGALDGWGGATKLTVDLFVRKMDGLDWAANTGLCGLVTPVGPSPWVMYLEAGPAAGAAVCLNVLTADGRNRKFYAPFTYSTQNLRVSFQLDLAAGTCRAYVGRTQVAADVTLAGPDFASGGLSFARNYFGYFGVGTVGYSFGTTGSAFTNADLLVCGCRVTRNTVYQNAGVGQPQAYVGGGAVSNDDNLYSFDSSFTGGTTTGHIGHLPLQEAYQAGRAYIGWTGGNAGNLAGHGFFFRSSAVTDYKGVGTVISGVQTLHPSDYGIGILQGTHFGANVGDCWMKAGAIGYYGPTTPSDNYPVIFDRNTFDGPADCAMETHWPIGITARGTKWNDWGRQAFRGCGVGMKFDGGFVVPGRVPENCFFVQGAREFALSDFTFNFEGAPASGAYVHLTLDDNFHSNVEITRVKGSTSAAGVPWLDLRSWPRPGDFHPVGPNCKTGSVVLEGMGNVQETTDSTRPFVRVDGPRWKVFQRGERHTGVTPIGHAFYAAGSKRYSFDNAAVPAAVPPADQGINLSLASEIICRVRSTDAGVLADGATVPATFTSSVGGITVTRVGAVTYHTNQLGAAPSIRSAGGYLTLPGLTTGTGEISVYLLYRNGGGGTKFSTGHSGGLQVGNSGAFISGQGSARLVFPADDFVVVHARLQTNGSAVREIVTIESGYTGPEMRAWVYPQNVTNQWGATPTLLAGVGGADVDAGGEFVDCVVLRAGHLEVTSLSIAHQMMYDYSVGI